jgi:hypothetical protein
MNGARPATRGYPVDEFLQALTAQLDRAQDALALKVTGTDRPLTWALKDLSIDLRVFVQIDSESGAVLIQSAGPNEEGASTMHINLTTITRPMVEENALSFHADADPRPVREISAAANLDEAHQRKLDWMGVRTVGQLRQLDPNTVQAVMGIPVSRLQAALEAAARPAVLGSEVVSHPAGRMLRIRGANLSDIGGTEVKLRGENVEVLEATPQHLLVRPLPHHLHTEGPLEVLVKGARATGYFRMGDAPQQNGTASGAGRAP